MFGRLSMLWLWQLLMLSMKIQRNDRVSKESIKEKLGEKGETIFLWKQLPTNTFAAHSTQQIAFCMYFVYARSYLLHIQVVGMECATVVWLKVMLSSPR